MEVANRKAWVLASPEILEELRKGWSRPVHVHAIENPDGSWDMTLRSFDGVLADLVREIKRKLSTHAYDDEAGLEELNNSVEMLNAEAALEPSST